MARRSMGLQFAIHFRVRPYGSRPPAFNNFVIVRLARFGGRHRLPPPQFLIVFAEGA